MPDWLATARNTLLREAAAPTAVPFERVCLCGEPLVGQRDESPGTIICGRCRRSWFVLPADAYPHPKRRKSKKRSGWGKSNWGRSARTNGPRQTKQTSSAAPPNETQSDATRETAADTQTATAIPIGPTWRERLRGHLKRGARPIRLIVGGIVVLFVLTGFWLWHQARLDNAAAVLVAAVPAAEAAILEENLPEAASQMGAAARALKILGSDDATARRIRQRHRELVAITELASLTPYDLAAEAELSSNNPQRWSSRFAASYAGQWVILDVPLGKIRPATSNAPKTVEKSRENSLATEEGEDASDEAAEEKPAAPVEMVIPLNLPLRAGNVPVRLELEAERFKQLAGSSRAIIALQYDSWRMMRGAAGESIWVVRFNPGTAFAWASPDLFQAAGFDPHDPLLPAKQQLAQQAKMLGIAEGENKAMNSKKPAPENDK